MCVFLTTGQICTGLTKVFVCTGDNTIRTFKEEGGGLSGRLPVLGEDFTYTGNCQVIEDSVANGQTNWRIKFLTSGVLTFASDVNIDAFLVGGGMPGGAGTDGTADRGGTSGSGGTGGKCITNKNIEIQNSTSYQIVIGSSSGNSSAFGLSASAGGNGVGGQAVSSPIRSYNTSTSSAALSGNPGSGGSYEFGETGSTMYGGAGGSGGAGSSYDFGGSMTTIKGSGGAGSAAGGGSGGDGAYWIFGRAGSGHRIVKAQYGSSGTPNRGGGGGGGGGGFSYSPREDNSITPSASRYTSGASGGSGGSGIVIIRNHRE